MAVYYSIFACIAREKNEKKKKSTEATRSMNVDNEIHSTNDDGNSYTLTNITVKRSALHDMAMTTKCNK